MKTVLKRFNIRGAGNAMDIGCGKGGAMITPIRHGFKRVNGLELSDKLVAIARKNLKTLGLDGMCSVYCGDAANCDRYDDYEFFYLYNPFPYAMVIPFVSHLLSSLERRPRACTILYATPVGHRVIEGSGLFEKVGQITNLRRTYFIYQSCCRIKTS